MTEVGLWAVDLARPKEECDALAATLSADELARAGNMRIEAARRRFIVARGALRALVARRLGTDPRAIEFGLGAHGKPFVRDASLRFNVSHSAELCLIALAREMNVGVDIEIIRARENYPKIAERYFTTRECDWIARAGDPLTAFYRCWVAKEAFVKGAGLGLAVALQSVEVELEPAPRIVRAAGDTRQWSLAMLDPARGYAAALVTDGAAAPSAVRLFDPLGAARS